MHYVYGTRWEDHNANGFLGRADRSSIDAQATRDASELYHG